MRALVAGLDVPAEHVEGGRDALAAGDALEHPVLAGELVLGCRWRISASFGAVTSWQ